jgi:hypothetical protein
MSPVENLPFCFSHSDNIMQHVIGVVHITHYISFEFSPFNFAEKNNLNKPSPANINDNSARYYPEQLEFIDTNV